MSRELNKMIRKEMHEVKTLKELSKELSDEKSMELRNIILKKDKKITFLRKLNKEMEK